MSSRTSHYVDDSASLAAMLEAFVNISDSARQIKDQISQIEGRLRDLTPESQVRA